MTITSLLLTFLLKNGSILNSMPNPSIPQKTITFYQVGISDRLAPDKSLNVTIQVRDWDDQIDATLNFTIPPALRPIKAIMVGQITMRFLQEPPPEEPE